MDAVKEREIPFLWKWTVFTAAAWWFLGLNLFIYHIAAAFLFFTLIQGLPDKKLFIGPSASFLTMLSLVYFCSIIIRCLVDGGERSLAALYNLSFWVMGILLVLAMSNYYSSRFQSELPKVLRFLSVTIAVIFMVFMAYWFFSRQAIIIETPLYKPLRGIDTAPLGLIENSLLVKPVFLDWFASFSTPRFNIFSPYATAAAAMMMMVIMITACDSLGQKKFFHPFYFVPLISTCAALIMTLSRMSIFAFLFTAAVLFIVKRKQFFLWVLLAVFIFAEAAPWIYKTLSFVLSLRHESNLGRLDVYRTSLGMLQGWDWILGLGLKPREETLQLPLGSQSTYISLLFKTGILGLFLFIGFQFTLLKRWFHLRKQVMNDRSAFFFWCGLGGAFISVGIWFLTDDLDAPQFMAFLYFSLVGIFEGFERQFREKFPESD